MNRTNLIAIFLCLLLPLAYADTQLTAAGTAATCRVDFTLAAMNSVVSGVPDTATELSSPISTLQADSTQLQQLVAGGNRSTVATFVKGTLTTDLKTAQADLRTARQSYGPNVTKTTRQSIIASFKTEEATDDSCILSARQQFGTAKVAAYNTIIIDAQNASATLAAKGLDTSEMNTIINDAQTQIVTPLQTAVNSATNSSTVNAALNAYCIYDGCKDGTNFHLAAKLAIARLSVALTYEQQHWNLTSTQVSNVQTSISAASAELSSVGTAQYTSNTAWDDIKAAAQALRSVRPTKGGAS